MNKKKIIYYTLVLFFFVLFLVFFLDIKNEKIKEIDIKILNSLENDYISKEDILRELKKKLKDKKIKDIDFIKLKEKIQKHNIIENIDISLNSNYILEIFIKQRIPICRVFETNESYYLDRNGVFIENNINYSPEVILVIGKIDKENKYKIINLVNFISEDKFLKRQIIGIDINEKDEVMMSVLVGNHKIYFGKIENIEDKFLKLKVFYDKYLNSDILSNYKVLNLKFKDQIIGEK